MIGRKRLTLTADFETTTKADDCRVWGWGIANVETAKTLDDVEIGTDIESFIERIITYPAVIYFHNLAFDSAFILDYLFRIGYRHVQDKAKHGEFSTLISDTGKFYSIKVVWENGCNTEFRDSIKKLPMSVKNVAKAFKLDEAKGEIDYHKERPIGYVITDEEKEYIALDVLIVARAMFVQLNAGMTALTVGADALAEYRKLTGKDVFKRMFPVLPETMDAEIRKAYRGGFTYADDRFKGQLTGPGKVYDVNSLYPSVMYDRLLPYGEPIFCEGLPEVTKTYPLFIVSLTFTAKLKKNHIPCIQVKGNSMFGATEYQKNIHEPVTLTCTNVDLEMWQEHYEMDILAYNGGWRFQAVAGVFSRYIDKWMKVKSEHTGGMREIAKLHLNSLYGKFATNPNVTGKIPVFEDNQVKLKIGPEETRDPVYTAMGVFITAYARQVTITAAQKLYPVFAYADTDSLHLLIDGDHPDGLDVDPQKLGAWKHEYDFDKALFIRAKAYSERTANGQVTHIAGMPEAIARHMRFQDFQDGTVFRGKLLPKRVPGGIVLQDVGFTLSL